MSDVHTPVLIVGGGACGLFASCLLSDLGIQHVLVERHSGTSHLPKAHYLNQRTMEVFRQHGLADTVYAAGTPMPQMSKVRWCTSLGGSGALDGRTFHEMDAFGGGATAAVYAKDSACPSSNYPQLRLEPLLRARAERGAPGRILFSHELTGLTQHDNGVSASVVDLQTGKPITINAEYVLAADGGKTVGNLLGVKMDGITGLGRIASSHISADLSDWWDDNCLITWFINPEGSGALGSGAMVPMGPTWGRRSEEWVIHFAFAPNDPQEFDEEAIVPRLRDLLKLPELQIKVHKISQWELEAVLAERYQVGRVFLLGDAAHRHPPTTGLGLNTAIQDAHNIAWKLALVLRGVANRQLLDTYEQERQPVGQRNVDWAMFTAMNHHVLDAGMGFSPLQSPAMRRANFEAYFADTPMGATRRARAAEVINTQRVEFQAHDMELGFVYEQGALIADGTPPPPRDPMGHLYMPAARPGHRLPHGWLEEGGQRRATHDFVGPDASFVLFCATDREYWAHASVAASRATGISLHVAWLPPSDMDRDWLALAGISPEGAVLVRPDHHVAWRARERPLDAAAALTHALDAILGHRLRS